MGRTESAAGFYVGDRGRHTAGQLVTVVLVAAARDFFLDFARQSRGSHLGVQPFGFIKRYAQVSAPGDDLIGCVLTMRQLKTSLVVGRTRKWVAAMFASYSGELVNDR